MSRAADSRGGLGRFTRTGASPELKAELSNIKPGTNWFPKSSGAKLHLYRVAIPGFSVATYAATRHGFSALLANLGFQHRGALVSNIIVRQTA